MVQYLKVGILSMNAEDNYLLHRVALHACRINPTLMEILSTLAELTSTLMEILSTLAELTSTLMEIHSTLA